MYKQIGIITGGGDAPGLNAVIRAAVRTAVKEFGIKCVGIEDSFEGLTGETQTMRLTTRSVSGILPRGGTMLGTRNSGSFCCFEDGQVVFPEETIKAAIENLKKLEIEALVVIGGDGTLAIAQEFYKR
ncbi:MAG: 6-phosphofructokinase, partial [Acidobacteria bacterium]|nr:6-phosphofructokinase [Acidobacteriota bacterium]